MRILQLSTHSTLIPRHGGKLRSHHIGRVLEEAGFDVSRIAVCFRAPDDVDDPREPILDVGRLGWGQGKLTVYESTLQYLSDYIPTIVALETPWMLQEFDALVGAAQPDVVLLEHPWTWPLLARLEEVRSGAVRVVYSSQNVEAPLKRRILAEQCVEPPPGLLEGVEELERDLVVRADAVAACTQADADTFIAWGAKRAVVAPNGGVRRKREHLLDVLPWPLEPEHAYALVVGSGHPPNVSGFMELVAPSLPLLRPNQRVAVAGGAADRIMQALAEKGLARMAEGRLVSLGMVDNLCLDCLIGNAHAILLPIQYGGGSNVKTAEALLSGRPIVAAEAAMRGFDRFRDAPGMTVAEDAVGFGKALRAALDQPFQAQGADSPALTSLLWESTIEHLVDLMRDMDRGVTARQRPAAPSPSTALHTGREA